MSSKLRNAPSLIRSLPYSYGLLPNEQQAPRTETAPWQRWYGMARWKRLRLHQFVEDQYTCRMCGKLEPDPSKLVCDHVNAHRGNWEAFWRGPFQTLCKSPCHDKIKQKQEHARTMRGEFIG
jgi:5-methylcytosine-specific restriction protein A